MIKAALLARVSGEGQRDNSSHDSQLERGRNHCRDNNYQIVTERREVFSGAFVLARSDFNELLEMGASGQIDVIVVDIPDRLGRGDVIAKCELLAQLNGCRIEYARKGYDTSTVEGMASHAMEQLVSGIERLKIGERTANGKIDLAKGGRVISAPRRPYGYGVINTYNERGTKIACTLEIVEEEAEIIRMMFEMCAREGYTVTGLSKYLTKAGIPRISQNDPETSPTRVSAKKRNTQWDNWPRSTISAILHNPLYKGQWQYGKRRIIQYDAPGGVKSKSYRRDQDDIVTVPVPQIVSAEVWEIVQQRLKSNKGDNFLRPTKRIFLLRQHLRCALCGSLFYCIDGSRGYRYYRCQRRQYESLNQHCHAKPLNADEIETVVWDVVCQEMQHPDRLLAGAQKKHGQYTKSRQVIEQALTALEALDVKDNQSKERYLGLYGEGLLEKDKYLVKIGELDAKIDKRQKEREELVGRMQGIPNIDPQFADTLASFTLEISDRLHPDVSADRKLALLRLLSVECVYNSDTDELNISGLFGSRSVPVRGDRIVSTASGRGASRTMPPRPACWRDSA